MANTSAQFDDIKARLMSRVPAACAAAIGGKKTIRLDAKTTRSGTIVECEFARFENTGRALEVVFRIVMECGVSKTRQEFNVRNLPT